MAELIFAEKEALSTCSRCGVRLISLFLPKLCSSDLNDGYRPGTTLPTWHVSVHRPLYTQLRNKQHPFA